MRVPWTSAAAADPGASSLAFATVTSFTINASFSGPTTDHRPPTTDHRPSPPRIPSHQIKLHQPELQPGRLGHHALVPGRVPDQLHVGLVDFLDREQFVLHVL